MAWQAQTYKERCLNNLTEQRIAVACLTDNGLKALIQMVAYGLRHPWE
jgi:hypothetical protein